MKENLKMFLLLTGMFFLLMIGGSVINYTLSIVFMETFKTIQCSCIWVFHTVLIIIFTVTTAQEMFDINK